MGEAGVPFPIPTPSFLPFAPGVESAPPTHIPGLLEEVTDPGLGQGKSKHCQKGRNGSKRDGDSGGDLKELLVAEAGTM